jgi:hypothetical protein
MLKQELVCASFEGFSSGQVEGSALLANSATSLGDWCPTFRDSLLVSCARAEKSNEDEFSRLFDHCRSNHHAV